MLSPVSMEIENKSYFLACCICSASDQLKKGAMGRWGLHWLACLSWRMASKGVVGHKKQRVASAQFVNVAPLFCGGWRAGIEISFKRAHVAVYSRPIVRSFSLLI